MDLTFQVSMPAANGPHISAAKRSYHMPKVRGDSQEEQPHVQGAAATRAERSYSTFKVRRGGIEEIPLV